MITRRFILGKIGHFYTGILLFSALLQSRIVEAVANRRGFSGKNLEDILKERQIIDYKKSVDVELEAPEIAENGAVVPIKVSTHLADVKEILIVAEKNPLPFIAAFQIHTLMEANITTRIKLAQSSKVYGLIVFKNNRALFTEKEVKVTVGGCGG